MSEKKTVRAMELSPFDADLAAWDDEGIRRVAKNFGRLHTYYEEMLLQHLLNISIRIPERDEYSVLRGYLQSIRTGYSNNLVATGFWSEGWSAKGRRFRLTPKGLSEWSPEEEAMVFITADEPQAIAYLRSLPELQTNE